MRTAWKSLSVLSVFALGYLAGSLHWSADSAANAQGFGADEATNEVSKSITSAYSALQTLRGNLKQEGRYIPATKVMNVSALMAGGVDAISDLETGRGVDPETFAGLYAGHAVDEVAANLGEDDQGRLTYQGKVLRMYSVERLKEFFQRRLQYVGEEDDTPGF